jgi:hypothetical protein
MAVKSSMAAADQPEGGCDTAQNKSGDAISARIRGLTMNIRYKAYETKASPAKNHKLRQASWLAMSVGGLFAADLARSTG